MRERLCIAALYADRYARTAAKAVVVGIAARVDGFKAGYELANNRVTI